MTKLKDSIGSFTNCWSKKKKESVNLKTYHFKLSKERRIGKNE